MDRLFLDANVLFSAAYRPDSGLRVLWDLPVAKVTSAYAVEEARRNLAHLRPEALVDLLRLCGSLDIAAQPATDQDIPESIALAEKDRPILAAAITTRATHLLTGDKAHFGHLYEATVHGVLILPPGAYLRSYRESL